MGPVGVIAALLFFGGLGLGLYNLWFWAKYATWPGHSTAWLLQQAAWGDLQGWLAAPETWLGAHQLLSWLPGWISLVAVSMALLLAAVWVEER